MADEKLTALPNLAVPISTDIVYVVDDPGGVPLSRQATIAAVVTAGSPDIGARAYNSGNISINSGVLTVLTFDSERWDTDGIHSLVANTGRLTCNTAGKYLILGNIVFAASAAGFRVMTILLNGATNIAWQALPTLTVAGPPSWRGIVSTVYDLSVTDYVELQVFQDSGGALNVTAIANYSPEFMMQKIG